MSTTTTVTHPDGTTVTCTTTTVASPENLVLKYWNGRGLMEVARQLLAVSEEWSGARAAPPPDTVNLLAPAAWAAFRTSFLAESYLRA